jgi:iron complex outermembrane receptor protein
VVCKRDKHSNTQLKPIAALVALAMLAMGSDALAQEDPAKSGQLETVVVTANKRIEKLESVPMAISVLSEAEIARNNIREIEDVVALSPSLTMKAETTAANNALYMRGIGTFSIGIGVESDVSVIIDDIPIAVQFQAFRDLADVSRIEVLKGPQSTLFGKSAVAGAINIVTKPIGGPMVYRGSTYYTNDGEWRLGLSAGGMVSETFGMRLAANRSSMPGSFHNLTTGKDVNGTSGTTFMAKLSWRPTSALGIDLMPHYNDQVNTRGISAINGFRLANGTPADVATAYMNGNPLLPASVVLAGSDPHDANNRNVRRDYPTGLTSRTAGSGLKVSYSLPSDAVLMSISSYERYKADDYRDNDLVDVPTLARPGVPGLTVGSSQFGTYDIRSSTQELRLVSPDRGNLRYVAGLWWARNEIDRHFVRGFCVAPTVCAANSNSSSPTNYFTDIYNVNKAVFGQASWDFAPTYTLVAGLRRNIEESGFHFQRGFFTDQIDRASFKPDPVGVDQFGSSGNLDHSVTGKLSLQKQINADWMVYAMAATGHKGKAYDVTSGLQAAAAFPVAPERSQTVELGAKANLFHNRMSLAATAFNTEFFGYQQNVSFILPNDPIVYTQLNSIPRIRTHGFELDTHFLVTPGFSMNAALAYTLPTIEEWKNGPCYNDATNVAVGDTRLGENGSLVGRNRTCFPIKPGSTTGIQDVSGGVFPGTPKLKANVGGNADFKVPGMSFGGFINGNVRYQSDYQTSIANDPRAFNKAYSIADLGFGLRDNRDRYKLSFRINNLFNRFYIPNASAGGPQFRAGPTGTSPSITVDSWVPPRDVFRFYSVKLDVKY